MGHHATLPITLRKTKLIPPTTRAHKCLARMQTGAAGPSVCSPATLASLVASQHGNVASPRATVVELYV